MAKTVLVNPLDLRGLQKVLEYLQADLTKAHTDLGSGSQIIREDASATGMNCARYVGKIEGLKVAVKRLRQVDNEINERQPDEDLD